MVAGLLPHGVGVALADHVGGEGDLTGGAQVLVQFILRHAATRGQDEPSHGEPREFAERRALAIVSSKGTGVCLELRLFQVIDIYRSVVDAEVGKCCFLRSGNNGTELETRK